MAPDDTAVPPEAAPPRSSRRRALLVAVAVVNLFAIGGVGYATMRIKDNGVSQPKRTRPAPEASASTSEAQAPSIVSQAEQDLRKLAFDDPGRLVKLDPPFVVNLADAQAPRYIKVEIRLQLDDEDAKREVENNNARVRDSVIAYLSELRPAQTVGALGKRDMKFALKRRINRTLPSDPVERVYFTEFVVH